MILISLLKIEEVNEMHSSKNTRSTPSRWFIKPFISSMTYSWLLQSYPSLLLDVSICDENSFFINSIKFIFGSDTFLPLIVDGDKMTGYSLMINDHILLQYYSVMTFLLLSLINFRTLTISFIKFSLSSSTSSFPVISSILASLST